MTMAAGARVSPTAVRNAVAGLCLTAPRPAARARHLSAPKPHDPAGVAHA